MTNNRKRGFRDMWTEEILCISSLKQVYTSGDKQLTHEMSCWITLLCTALTTENNQIIYWLPLELVEITVIFILALVNLYVIKIYTIFVFRLYYILIISILTMHTHLCCAIYIFWKWRRKCTNKKYLCYDNQVIYSTFNCMR